MKRCALLAIFAAALAGCGSNGPAGLEFNTLDGCPHWSPEGSWVAFSRGPVERSRGADVYVVDSEGSHLGRVP